MNIFGITIDHSTNYGSAFQAYALQTVINRMTVRGEPCRYRLIPFMKLKGQSRDKKWYLMQPVWIWNRSRFRHFDRKHMKYADCRHVRDLASLNKTADAFVCGSDVIWRPDYSKKTQFLLDFAEKYAFSYAASFGVSEIDEDARKRCGKFLARFREIGVREKSAADIVKACCGKDAQVVADPVMMLKREDWEQIAAPAKKEKPYIFVYETHVTAVIDAFVARLRQQTGERVVMTVAGPKQALKKGILQIHSPEHWLRILRDADYVVTNSFHATVLCLLYHKQFYTVVQGEKEKGINVRMWELLEKTGMSAQLFNETPAQIDLSEISFDAVDNKLDALRADSFAFLQRNLDAAYLEKTQSDIKEN